MNLVIQKVKGKQYVSFKESFWDPQRKKYSSRTVKNFGRLDLLEKENPHILDELRQQVQKAREISQQKKELALKQRLNAFSEETQKDPFCDNLSVCLGSSVYRQIWNKLQLQRKFNQLAAQTSVRFNFADAVFFLLSARCLLPDSKLNQWKNKNRFLYGAQKLSLNSLYRTLELLINHKDSIVGYVNKQISKQYDRKVSVALYDVTTYYFESQNVDKLRNFGFSKDNKVNQVQVVMGLLIDERGIPIDYELYPGNTSEFGTMVPLLEKIKTQYQINKVIVTADRGLNSGNNLRLIRQMGMDYVIAYRLCSAPVAIKKLVYDETGWTYRGAEPGTPLCDVSRYRITRETRTVNYKQDGKTKKEEISLNLLINYSAKRAAKDKRDRERLISKAERFVSNPALLKSELRKGGKSYLHLDSATTPELDVDRIKEAELFDGYYAIAYSDSKMKPQQVMEIHHSLWQIEQSFRICKSLLNARPCFHWTEQRIRGHFLVCYLALTMQRLLEVQLRQKELHFSTESIMEALQSAVLQKVNVRPGEAIYCKSYTEGNFEKICEAVDLGRLPTVANEQQVKKALHLSIMD